MTKLRCLQDKHKQTSLLCSLQAQTLPDATPPMCNSRRYGQLRGPTSSSCRELQLLEPEYFSEIFGALGGWQSFSLGAEWVIQAHW